MHAALQEINAREEAGEFVAGALGAGGAHPMRTPEERRARAAAAAAAEASDEGAGQVRLGSGLGSGLGSAYAGQVDSADRTTSSDAQHMVPRPSPAIPPLARQRISP